MRPGGWESFKHQVDYGDIYPGFTGLRALLIVFAQPSASTEPRQRTLNHPPAGQHLKAMTIRFPPHHGQQLTASGPGHQLTSVASTSLASSRSACRGTGQALNVGGMDHHGQQGRRSGGRSVGRWRRWSWASFRRRDFGGDFGGQKLRDKPNYRAANGRAPLRHPGV